jgi:nucleotide-binding universal stress UspA family protein
LYQRILVPLDGSPQAEHALPWAAAIAARSGATLHLALVHEPDAYTEYGAASFEDFDQENKVHETAYLNSICQRLTVNSGITAEVHHLEGVIEKTLAAEVVARKIDLVVMNVHGWGYTSRALLGSVSDYLVRNLEVPLLLMHAQAQVRGGDWGRPLAIRRVLVPLDGSELAASILAPAQALGDLWNAEYRLVRVVVAPSAVFEWLGNDPNTEQEMLDQARVKAERYLEATAHLLREQNRPVSTQVLAHRKVAAAIVQESATSECDLIALSTSGRGGLPRLLVGSVADKVVRHADTPVLVYRPPLAH